jgi:hypothetical protein
LGLGRPVIVGRLKKVIGLFPNHVHTYALMAEISSVFADASNIIRSSQLTPALAPPDTSRPSAMAAAEKRFISISPLSGFPDAVTLRCRA